MFQSDTTDHYSFSTIHCYIKLNKMYVIDLYEAVRFSYIHYHVISLGNILQLVRYKNISQALYN